jgi:mRNA-degrading endonuclease RelE of RelBE toxin-antitoxin system
MDSTGSDDEWDWTFSPRADDQFAQLDGASQERIVSKLDDVVASEWRSPEDYLDPVRNSPFQKLRVGDYRLGCRILQMSGFSVSRASGNEKGRTKPMTDETVIAQ